MELLQHGLVTVIACAAGAIVIRRLLGFARRPPGPVVKPSCASCASCEATADDAPAGTMAS